MQFCQDLRAGHPWCKAPQPSGAVCRPKDVRHPPPARLRPPQAISARGGLAAIAFLTLGLLALAGCGTHRYSDSASAAPMASHRVAGDLGCRQARAELHQRFGFATDLRWPCNQVLLVLRKAADMDCAEAQAEARQRLGLTALNSGTIPCTKALIILVNLPPKISSARRLPVHSRRPPLLPLPPPQPPAPARQIQTGPDIGQWAPTETTITSLWMDLEAGMDVQVGAASIDRDHQRGFIFVYVINQLSDSGKIHNYPGGTYFTPEPVGPLTLTKITGSLATRNMVIAFSYPDGNGTLDPRTGQFTMP